MNNIKLITSKQYLEVEKCTLSFTLEIINVLNRQCYYCD